ncbi:hypothetical protein PSQ40_07475 [Curvibacter sp. HBC61]|uniref:HNH nuclease domain-containing protein n=1 Tax=Curvibacter cyanobacteriorum TaxID=3026422 RepID=A0ABT5MY89_9BURK|nr:hypothetical protein [Curvibacter sp. HBC61]MDD0838406.1 hypothetical protein [Curvibacter sp. HBC61]
MIGLKLAKEPALFDSRIRNRGLSAIDEMVGRPPRVKHPGRGRKKIAAVETDIPPEKFPAFWREAIDDMMTLYEHRCSYLAMYIEETGGPTVDHVIPKSVAWNLVYEWKNYRLCAGVVNAHKGALLGLVDPMEAKVGWFALDLILYRIVRGATAPNDRHDQIDRTLPMLNTRDCCAQRRRYVEEYRRGPGAKGIDITYLEHRAPFIATELRRQGQLVRGDV